MDGTLAPTGLAAAAMPVTTMGAAGFTEGLRRCGVQAVLRGHVLTFTLPAVGGHHSDGVETGVATAELQPWPAIPPHWIHLPAEIHVSRTNADINETLPGWKRHSRQITGWGDAQEPAQAWLAHVRAVLLEGC